LSAPDTSDSVSDAAPGLARRLGPFDATMVVMGGIIGSGIFMNPAVVARQVHTPALMLGAWAVGGAIALLGALVWAELAARRPKVGGQYAYVREAFHPSLAFVYGWGLLLVSQSGGMAAVAVTFARYARELGFDVTEKPLAALVLAALTVVNCFGVRAGAAAQNLFMVAKLVAIAALVVVGLLAAPHAGDAVAAGPALPALDLVTAFGAALVPVLFAYGGWQTAAFLAGEVRDPRRNLPRGLLLGVAGVVVLYLSVSWVCVRVLGAEGLAATVTPASDMMRAVLGAPGARLIAAGIAVSTVGFLAQSMLTAPRVYYAMAADGSFFRAVAWVSPRTQVPVVAIVLQGIVATVVAWSGSYEQILSYVVAVDWIFFGSAAASLFVLRRRDRASGAEEPPFEVPGHPVSTLIFVVVAALVVLNTLLRYPVQSLIGFAILATGFPVYLFWRRPSGTVRA
jgi:APA family basic amino acid/polyamine antiporter